jgi:hypothetical protein
MNNGKLILGNGSENSQTLPAFKFQLSIQTD